MLAPQAGNAGSNPARVTDRQDQVVQLVDTRRSERRARNGLGSSTLPLVTAGGTGVRLAFIRPACPDRYRGLQLSTPVGQRPAKPHKLRRPGATPGPDISALGGMTNADGRVRKRWQSDQVESLVILWVRLPPRSLTKRSRGPTARHQPDMLATMVQFHPGSIDHNGL